MQDVRIFEADLNRADHQQAIVAMVDSYSQEPMGDGKPLAPEVRARLMDGLRNHPTTIVFLAYRREEPIGVAVCFRGFSTFAAKPLINIHDLHVVKAHQRQGIGKALLAAVEAKARATGCCKLSLEVQANNHRARRTYESFGFAQRELQAEAGPAFYLTKDL